MPPTTRAPQATFVTASEDSRPHTSPPAVTPSAPVAALHLLKKKLERLREKQEVLHEYYGTTKGHSYVRDPRLRQLAVQIADLEAQVDGLEGGGGTSNGSRHFARLASRQRRSAHGGIAAVLRQSTREITRNIVSSVARCALATAAERVPLGQQGSSPKLLSEKDISYFQWLVCHLRDAEVIHALLACDRVPLELLAPLLSGATAEGVELIDEDLAGRVAGRAVRCCDRPTFGLLCARIRPQLVSLLLGRGLCSSLEPVEPQGAVEGQRPQEGATAATLGRPGSTSQSSLGRNGSQGRRAAAAAARGDQWGSATTTGVALFSAAAPPTAISTRLLLKAIVHGWCEAAEHIFLASAWIFDDPQLRHFPKAQRGEDARMAPSAHPNDAATAQDKGAVAEQLRCLARDAHIRLVRLPPLALHFTLNLAVQQRGRMHARNDVCASHPDGNSDAQVRSTVERVLRAAAGADAEINPEDASVLAMFIRPTAATGRAEAPDATPEAPNAPTRPSVYGKGGGWSGAKNGDAAAAAAAAVGAFEPPRLWPGFHSALIEVGARVAGSLSCTIGRVAGRHHASRTEEPDGKSMPMSVVVRSDTPAFFGRRTFEVTVATRTLLKQLPFPDGVGLHRFGWLRSGARAVADGATDFALGELAAVHCENGFPAARYGNEQQASSFAISVVPSQFVPGALSSAVSASDCRRGGAMGTGPGEGGDGAAATLSFVVLKHCNGSTQHLTSPVQLIHIPSSSQHVTITCMLDCERGTAAFAVAGTYLGVGFDGVGVPVTCSADDGWYPAASVVVPQRIALSWTSDCPAVEQEMTHRPRHSHFSSGNDLQDDFHRINSSTSSARGGGGGGRRGVVLRLPQQPTRAQLTALSRSRVTLLFALENVAPFVLPGSLRCRRPRSIRTGSPSPRRAGSSPSSRCTTEQWTRLRPVREPFVAITGADKARYLFRCLCTHAQRVASAHQHLTTAAASTPDLSAFAIALHDLLECNIAPSLNELESLPVVRVPLVVDVDALIDELLQEHQGGVSRGEATVAPRGPCRGGGASSTLTSVSDALNAATAVGTSFEPHSEDEEEEEEDEGMGRKHPEEREGSGKEPCGGPDDKDDAPLSRNTHFSSTSSSSSFSSSTATDHPQWRSVVRDFSPGSPLVDHNEAASGGSHEDVARLLPRRVRSLLLTATVSNLKAAPLAASIHLGLIDLAFVLASTAMVNVNQADDHGNTPALLATLYGIPRLLDFLLTVRGASLVPINFDGFSALHVAISNSRSECLDVMLRHLGTVDSATRSPVLDCATPSRSTPVSLAVKLNKLDILHRLLLLGANATKHDQHHATPLLFALRHAMPAAAELLLQCVSLGPFDVNVRERASQRGSPLLYAANHGWAGICQQLLERGADPSVVFETSGCSALHAAVLAESEQTAAVLIASEAADSRCADVRLRALNLNLQERRFGNSALHLACERGMLPIMRSLLQRGVDVNVRNKNGLTPFMLAIDAGLPSCAMAFVSSCRRRLRVDLADKSGNTALHTAAKLGQVDVVAALLDVCNADVNAVNNGGFTALALAIQAGNASTAETILHLAGGRLDLTQTRPSCPMPLELALLSREPRLAHLIAELSGGKIPDHLVEPFNQLVSQRSSDGEGRPSSQLKGERCGGTAGATHDREDVERCAPGHHGQMRASSVVSLADGPSSGRSVVTILPLNSEDSADVPGRSKHHHDNASLRGHGSLRSAVPRLVSLFDERDTPRKMILRRSSSLVVSELRRQSSNVPGSPTGSLAPTGTLLASASTIEKMTTDLLDRTRNAREALDLIEFVIALSDPPEPPASLVSMSGGELSNGSRVAVPPLPQSTSPQECVEGNASCTAPSVNRACSRVVGSLISLLARRQGTITSLRSLQVALLQIRQHMLRTLLQQSILAAPLPCAPQGYEMDLPRAEALAFWYLCNFRDEEAVTRIERLVAGQHAPDPPSASFRFCPGAAHRQGAPAAVPHRGWDLAVPSETLEFDVNCWTRSKWPGCNVTMLHVAVLTRNAPAVSYLISRGAQPTLRQHPALWLPPLEEEVAATARKVAAVAALEAIIPDALQCAMRFSSPNILEALLGALAELPNSHRLSESLSLKAYIPAAKTTKKATRKQRRQTAVFCDDGSAPKAEGAQEQQQERGSLLTTTPLHAFVASCVIESLATNAQLDHFVAILLRACKPVSASPNLEAEMATAHGEVEEAPNKTLLRDAVNAVDEASGLSPFALAMVLERHRFVRWCLERCLVTQRGVCIEQGFDALSVCIRTAPFLFDAFLTAGFSPAGEDECQASRGASRAPSPAASVTSQQSPHGYGSRRGSMVQPGLGARKRSAAGLQQQQQQQATKGDQRGPQIDRCSQTHLLHVVLACMRDLGSEQVDAAANLMFGSSPEPPPDPLASLSDTDALSWCVLATVHAGAQHVAQESSAQYRRTPTSSLPMPNRVPWERLAATGCFTSSSGTTAQDQSASRDATRDDGAAVSAWHALENIGAKLIDEYAAGMLCWSHEHADERERSNALHLACQAHSPKLLEKLMSVVSRHPLLDGSQAVNQPASRFERQHRTAQASKLLELELKRENRFKCSPLDLLSRYFFGPSWARVLRHVMMCIVAPSDRRLFLESIAPRSHPVVFATLSLSCFPGDSLPPFSIPREMRLASAASFSLPSVAVADGPAPVQPSAASRSASPGKSLAAAAGASTSLLQQSPVRLASGSSRASRAAARPRRLQGQFGMCAVSREQHAIATARPSSRTRSKGRLRAAESPSFRGIEQIDESGSISEREGSAVSSTTDDSLSDSDGARSSSSLGGGFRGQPDQRRRNPSWSARCSDTLLTFVAGQRDAVDEGAAASIMWPSMLHLAVSGPLEQGAAGVRKQLASLPAHYALFAAPEIFAIICSFAGASLTAVPAKPRTRTDSTSADEQLPIGKRGSSPRGRGSVVSSSTIRTRGSTKSPSRPGRADEVASDDVSRLQTMHLPFPSELQLPICIQDEDDELRSMRRQLCESTSAFVWTAFPLPQLTATAANDEHDDWAPCAAEHWQCGGSSARSDALPTRAATRKTRRGRLGSLARTIGAMVGVAATARKAGSRDGSAQRPGHGVEAPLTDCGKTSRVPPSLVQRSPAVATSSDEISVDVLAEFLLNAFHELAAQLSLADGPSVSGPEPAAVAASRARGADGRRREDEIGEVPPVVPFNSTSVMSWLTQATAVISRCGMVPAMAAVRQRALQASLTADSQAAAAKMAANSSSVTPGAGGGLNGATKFSTAPEALSTRLLRELVHSDQNVLTATVSRRHQLLLYLLDRPEVVVAVDSGARAAALVELALRDIKDGPSALLHAAGIACTRVLLYARAPITASALELLSDRQSGLGVNYITPGHRDSLLHLAVMNGCVEVAMALVRDPSFRLVLHRNAFGLRAWEYARHQELLRPALEAAVVVANRLSRVRELRAERAEIRLAEEELRLQMLDEEAAALDHKLTSKTQRFIEVIRAAIALHRVEQESEAVLAAESAIMYDGHRHSDDSDDETERSNAPERGPPSASNPLSTSGDAHDSSAQKSERQQAAVATPVQRSAGLDFRDAVIRDLADIHRAVEAVDQDRQLASVIAEFGVSPQQQKILEKLKHLAQQTRCRVEDKRTTKSYNSMSVIDGNGQPLVRFHSTLVSSTFVRRHLLEVDNLEGGARETVHGGGSRVAVSATRHSEKVSVVSRTQAAKIFAKAMQGRCAAGARAAAAEVVVPHAREGEPPAKGVPASVVASLWKSSFVVEGEDAFGSRTSAVASFVAVNLTLPSEMMIAHLRRLCEPFAASSGGQRAATQASSSTGPRRDGRGGRGASSARSAGEGGGIGVAAGGAEGAAATLWQMLLPPQRVQFNHVVSPRVHSQRFVRDCELLTLSEAQKERLVEIVATEQLASLELLPPSQIVAYGAEARMRTARRHHTDDDAEEDLDSDVSNSGGTFSSCDGDSSPSSSYRRHNNCPRSPRAAAASSQRQPHFMHPKDSRGSPSAAGSGETLAGPASESVRHKSHLCLAPVYGSSPPPPPPRTPHKPTIFAAAHSPSPRTAPVDKARTGRRTLASLNASL